jgi:hypothetical protein
VLIECLQESVVLDVGISDRGHGDTKTSEERSGGNQQPRFSIHSFGVFPVIESRFRVLWPDVGLEGTMNRWLVESGIPRRTSCANCAARTS